MVNLPLQILWTILAEILGSEAVRDRIFALVQSAEEDPELSNAERRARVKARLDTEMPELSEADKRLAIEASVKKRKAERRSA